MNNVKLKEKTITVLGTGIIGAPVAANLQKKAAAMMKDDYTTNFSIANAVKDAQLVVEAAEQMGISIDITRVGLQRFQRAIDVGHGDKDMVASGLVGRKQ